MPIKYPKRGSGGVHKASEPSKFARTVLRAPGVCLLIIGFVVTFYGFIELNAQTSSKGWTTQSIVGLGIMLTGLGLLIFGFILLYYGYVQREIERIKSDFRPGIKVIGEGQAVDSRDGSETLSEVIAAPVLEKASSAPEGTACPTCGHVDKKQANFCPQCGSKM